MVAALPIPTANPIAFAASKAASPYWPLVTRHPRALEVNTLLAGGSAAGSNPSRRFLADRSNGKRYHVGIDLYCSEGEDVIAIEDGKIANFYHFYEQTYALLVAHDGYVINYGEVAANSLSKLGLTIGSNVKAGQRIGTVGRLNMLHFETYAAGTTQNHSWPKSSARPANLRNPSQLLLDLAAGAAKLDPDAGIVGLAKAAQPLIETIALEPVVFSPDNLPDMDSKGWHRFQGGAREWAYDERGLATREGGVVTQQRWEASLATMRAITEAMGAELFAASAKHGVPPALLLMTVATEAAIYKSAGFTGPKTFRWEAHVENNDVNPVTKGDYSAGPMQTLGTTARWVIKAKGAAYGLNYDRFEVAPVFATKPNPAPAQHPLYECGPNLDIGAAEIRIRMNKTKLDPIFVAAAFNAGGLYANPNSPWGLKAYGDHLSRAAKWYGDACAHLIALGVN